MKKIVLLLAFFVGCDEPAPTFHDWRCQALCTIEYSSVEGAFDVCSEESAELCIALCEERIADVNNLCASCLLEWSRFQTDPVEITSECNINECTMYGREGQCTHPAADMAAQDDCYRQVFPRREVACSTQFRPVTECSDICIQP